MILIQEQDTRIRATNLPLSVCLAPIVAISVIASAVAALTGGLISAWSSVAVITASAIIAVVIVGQSPVEFLRLDAENDHLEIRGRNLITGTKTLIGPYRLRDLVAVRECQSQDASGDPVARLQLSLRDGTGLWFPNSGTTTNFTRLIRLIQKSIAQSAP